MQVSNLRRIIFRSCLAVLLLVVLVLVAINFVGNKVGVEILVAPSTSQILVDGANKRNGSGFIKMKPGTYKIVAQNEGFDSVEKEVTVEAKNNKSIVTFVLTPIDDGGYSYASANQQEFLEVEAKAGEALVEDGVELHTKHPIVSRLPYRSLLFNIDFKQPNENEIILEISASSPLERSYAIKQIENWGLNPHDYQIEFANITNYPFGESDEE
jgi:hypothetical protein